MDELYDKIGAIFAAVISALGGFYMYDRKVTHERLTKVEQSIQEQEVDVRELQVRLDALKEDTQEIKQGQQEILKVLTKGKGWMR